MMVLYYYAMYRKIALAHIFILFFFFMVYQVVLDFNAHFVASSSHAPLNALSPAYFAVAQHTLLGDGTCVPKTYVAKSLALLHALLTWVLTLGFFIL